LYYDVIVMGAGPAGCMAARALTGAGFKVAVLERERIPRDKACGGLLSPEAVELLQEAFGPIPEDCMSRPARLSGARLLCEEGGDYVFPFSGFGCSVARSRLDAFLAAGCGAEVMDGCNVTDLDVERFHLRARVERNGDEEVVESTYLVGADGAESLALRILRPEFHRLYAAPRLERTMLVLCGGDMDWDAEWMGLALMKNGMGISRFFIKDELIGLAVNHNASRGWRSELDGLTAFLERKVGLRLEGDAIRQVSSMNRMAVGGHHSLGAGCALLAGEAAGLVDPWGFGIYLALESGQVAAESIVESAGERITPHVRYRYRMQEILDRELKQRRSFDAKVGDLEVSSLAGDKSRTARRDRRALRRRFSR
jgi:flavin-dependent dehydrogenase